jgi:hypothetical protein
MCGDGKKGKEQLLGSSFIRKEHCGPNMDHYEELGKR